MVNHTDYATNMSTAQRAPSHPPLYSIIIFIHTDLQHFCLFEG